MPYFTKKAPSQFVSLHTAENQPCINKHFRTHMTKNMIYLPIPERSWTETTGEGGEMADVGQGVDKEDVPVSKPVEAEYDELIASCTNGLPFRKSLSTGQRREVGCVGAQNEISECIILQVFHHFSGIATTLVNKIIISRLINTENKPQYTYCWNQHLTQKPTCITRNVYYFGLQRKISILLNLAHHLFIFGND